MMYVMRVSKRFCGMRDAGCGMRDAGFGIFSPLYIQKIEKARNRPF